MAFQDYIKNIELYDGDSNEGDLAAIIFINMDAYGVSGNGEARIDYTSLINIQGTGYNNTVGEIIVAVTVDSYNANLAEVEFENFIETEGYAAHNVEGSMDFNNLIISSSGRGGNEGSGILLLQVNGEGNANREYEIC